MNAPQSHPKGNPGWTKHLLWFIPVVLISALIWFARQPPHGPTPPTSPAEVVEVPRSQLELRSNRLHQIGVTSNFNGWMVEHYPDGALRSRSAVTNGLLHGLSQGWHTNGQLQIAEYFKEGVSHGVRTKWHMNGKKLSECQIVAGQLHGTFRRWSEVGTLIEQAEFEAGQPHGVAVAYFESGFLKTRANISHRKVIDQKFWNEGESREMRPVPTLAPSQSIP